MMGNELEIFKNEEFGQIRAIEIDGESWFVGTDIASALGYKNAPDALARHVDNEDKKDGIVFHDTIGREQKPTLISESGMYSLIFSSKLEGAKKFKRWVTNEVLPSLRKTGVYETKKHKEEAPQRNEGKSFIDDAIKQLVDAVLTIKSASAPQESKSQNEIAIDYGEPSEQHRYTTTSIAKMYGTSAQTVHKILSEDGVIYKDKGEWKISSEYTDKNLVVASPVFIQGKYQRSQTHWTDEGLSFVGKKLEEHGKTRS